MINAVVKTDSHFPDKLEGGRNNQNGYLKMHYVHVYSKETKCKILLNIPSAHHQKS